MTALSFQNEVFQSFLSTRWLGRENVYLYDCIDSTNEEAKRLLQHEAPHGQVLVADTQMQGRGTQGRVWHSPSGKDLYVSLLLQSSFASTKTSLFTLAMGVAVAETVEQFVKPEYVKIKWPNDILVHEKKCAGILIEMLNYEKHSNAMIIGIGLNVNRTSWEKEIQSNATSMVMAIDEQNQMQVKNNSLRLNELSREHVLALLLNRVEYWVEMLHAQKENLMLHQVRSRLAWLQQWVRCDNVAGTLMGVDVDGALLIHDGVQVRRFIYGSLSIDAI